MKIAVTRSNALFSLWFPYKLAVTRTVTRSNACSNDVTARVTTRYCTRYCWFCMETIGFPMRYYALLLFHKKILKIFLYISTVTRSNALKTLWFPYKTNSNAYSNA